MSKLPLILTMTQHDIWSLYQMMVRSRKYEELVQQIWEEGKITGEMHMGIGEEAINVGVIANLKKGDALALDHRGTSASLLWGIDPTSLLLEFMGDKQGICNGNGGHMHIFSQDHLLASSGIVGASAPTAVGFALEMDYNNKDNIAVAFFGEGAINEGVVLEAMNLASIWELPVLFVCKDSQIAITTKSKSVTAGSIMGRAQAMSIEATEIDGTDVLTVWQVVGDILESMRSNPRPHFIQAHCDHKTGHFLGDPLHQALNMELIGPMVRSSFRRKGSNILRRFFSMINILRIIRQSRSQQKRADNPFKKMRQELRDDTERKQSIEKEVEKEMVQIMEQISIIRGNEL